MQVKSLLAVLSMLMFSSLIYATPLSTSLKQTSWLLEELGNKRVDANSAITLSFTANEITGSDGCNRYHGAYTITNQQLTIDKNIASTMMACPEAISQQATDYIKALMEAVSYKLNEQQLHLLDVNNKVLASFIAQPTQLKGTSWQVISSNNGKQAVVSAIIGSKLTAEFADNGKLSGLAGCNRYTAHYEATTNTIKINSVASTRKLCAKPEGVMQQEEQFLKALVTATTYRIEGNRLELRTDSGALAVMLTSP